MMVLVDEIFDFRLIVCRYFSTLYSVSRDKARMKREVRENGLK